MNIKVYFKINHSIFMKIMWMFLFALLFFINFLLISNLMENIYLPIIALFDALMIFAFICSKIYGFRIKNNKIRIISQYRVRVCKLEDIEKIDIEFRKVDQYYDCYAVLSLLNGKVINFVWDRVRTYKGPDIEFFITEDNVYEYVDMLTQCDKIHVSVN